MWDCVLELRGRRQAPGHGGLSALLQHESEQENARVALQDIRRSHRFGSVQHGDISEVGEREGGRREEREAGVYRSCSCDM